MITIEVEDADVQAALGLVGKVTSGDWRTYMGYVGVQLQRTAMAISPVVTGSYRRAHMITQGDKRVELSIDPRARNSASGVPVTSYMWPVEQRHSVYARTAGQFSRIAVVADERMYKEMGL